MKKIKTVNLIAAILVLTVSVMMFLPFWHWDGQSASINGYVWMPSEHTTLEKYLSDTLGYKTNVNEIVRMPALMFLLGWVGVALCLIKMDSAWQMLCTIPFGIFGIIGFFSCDALRLGSAWQLMLILCFAIVILDLIGLLSFRGK